MKILNKVLLAAALAGSLSWACQAGAQFYKPTGADGITASPRLRQQITERTPAPAVSPAPSVTVTYSTPSLDKATAASPKLRQMLAEQKVVVGGTPSTEVATTSYRATGPDGITASPKLRQQLAERGAAGTTFMIAPIK